MLLAVSGQARVGASFVPDLYRAQVGLEKGLANRLNLTVNGSFDYIDSTRTTRTARDARIATDFQYFINRALNSTETPGKNPLSIDFSGEADWTELMKPTYVGQLKLTIPILDGIDFPISVSYANQNTLLHEAHTVGKFGLTFDLSRLGNAFSKFGAR